MYSFDSISFISSPTGKVNKVHTLDIIFLRHKPCTHPPLYSAPSAYANRLCPDHRSSVDWTWRIVSHIGVMRIVIVILIPWLNADGRPWATLALRRRRYWPRKHVSLDCGRIS